MEMKPGRRRNPYPGIRLPPRVATIGVAVCFMALLVAPLSAGAPYLQHQVDAGRTGNSADPGPLRMDFGLHIQLPGQRPAGAPPLIIGNNVYVLTVALPGSAWATESGLWSIDLTTGAHTKVLEAPTPATSISSNGTHALLADQTHLRLYALNGGDPLWSMPLPFRNPPAGGPVSCGASAWTGDELYIACALTSEPAYSVAPNGADTTAVAIDSFALRANAATGQLGWVWHAPEQLTIGNPAVTGVAQSPEASVHRLVDVTVVGDLLAVGGMRTTATTGDRANWIINRHTGETAWGELVFERESSPSWYPDIPSVVGVDGLLVRVSDWVLEAHDVGTGDVRWSRDTAHVDEPTDPSIVYVNVGYVFDSFATRSSVIYTTGYAGLLAFSSDGEMLWETPIFNLFWEGVDGLIVAGDHLYGGKWGGGSAVFTRFDVATGTRLWTDAYPMSWNPAFRENSPTQQGADYQPSSDDAGATYQSHPTLAYAVGEGIAVAVPSTGLVTIYGNPPAGIQLKLSPLPAFPPLGALVTVDAAGSRPGVQAEDLEYRVIWGDGEADGWGDNPVLAHRYDDARQVTVLVEARNSAGQTASFIHTMNVGGTPPRAPTFLETAFNRDNQDATWGFIGILVTFLGAIIALGIRRARRSRLEYELRAIDEIVAKHQDNHAAAMSALNQRMTHIMEMLRKGAIEDGHYAVLDRRITDLSRTLRIGSLDDDFPYLPLGLARSLERYLADGRISRWERDRFLTDVRADKVLTKAQKNKVATRVADWFQIDEDDLGG